MKTIIAALLLSLSLPVFAADTAITLDNYYNAECSDYTGTWQGSITDPTDLFDNGGPWPLTVSLYAQNGLVWGRTTEVKSGKHVVFKRNEIWARCNAGKLQDIFWGDKSGCGALSQQGGLVSKNVLVISLNWENAMASARLLMFLQRKNNLAPYYEPSHMNAYKPAVVESCH